MAPRMRPAAKTHPPTACLISVSPVRLPVMKTLLATSRVPSAFARSVRPDINDEHVEPWSVPPRISFWRDSERKDADPLLPTTYSNPPTSRVISSPDVKRMVIVAVPLFFEDTLTISAFGRPSYNDQSR